MERATCTTCRVDKPVTDFRFRKDKGRRLTQCRDCVLADQRRRRSEEHEKIRESQRASERRMRADPARVEAHRAKRRAYYHATTKHKDRDRLAALKASDVWAWRVANMKRNINYAITVEWLKSVWADQGGCCALTGRPLDILTAEIDHKLPRSRGGTDDLENLRIVNRPANIAKAAMTDDELYDLCEDLLRIGRPLSLEFRLR